MDITKNLAYFRKDNHLTQEQMAEKLGMSKNGYAKLERGESKMTFEHLENIAQAFGIDDGVLFKMLRGGVDICTSHHTDHALYADNLKLIIVHKDETIELKNQMLAQKDREIELLKELLSYYRTE